MKNRSWFVFIVVLVVLLLASISIASAEPESGGAIACVLNITYDDYDENAPAYWDGRVEECEFAGRIRFFAIPQQYACQGNTIHFVEEFILNPDKGGEIRGQNWGVWNLSTAKFRAHGWVTDSEDYPEMVGYQYHEMGTTSTTDTSVRPITALGGKMKLAPGNRSLDNLPEQAPPNPCFPDL